jgi:hypothetical protein
MKTILALSLLLASSAFAKPVATITTSGGFTIVPRTSTLSVDENGSVTVETVTFASHDVGAKKTVKKVKVANLNPAIVKAIVSDVAEANNTTIVADDPDAPECTDVPAVVYSAVKDGALVTIGKRINCKAYFLDDYQARTAVQLLDNLLTLSYSAK